MPSTFEQLDDVTPLDLRVAQDVPLQLRDQHVLEAREIRMDTYDRRMTPTPELRPTEESLLSDDQVDLPSRCGIDRIELSTNRSTPFASGSTTISMSFVALGVA